jgi:uncharacterized membrane protein YkoI
VFIAGSVASRYWLSIERGRNTMTTMDILKIVAVALAIQAVGVMSLRSASAKAEACLDDWTQAAPIVRDNGLTPAKDLKALAKDHVEGDLKKVSLCQSDGKYVYQLMFIQGDGTVVDLEVDAKTPWQ